MPMNEISGCSSSDSVSRDLIGRVQKLMSAIRQESVSAMYSTANVVYTNHTRSTFIQPEDSQISRIFDSVWLFVFKERYSSQETPMGIRAMCSSLSLSSSEVRPPFHFLLPTPILLEAAWKFHKLSQSVDRVALSQFQARNRSSHSADCAQKMYPPITKKVCKS